uniref:Uncharacterized protein n=1 Tax=Cajanus cajan TaxID=3821 RepID=A0A151TS67_CAJCA|nr:hypothetical protein KK1_009098 [Cajanus cajan]
MVYYDESVLMSIASTIGTPIKMDTNTLTMFRGRFARVCVQINLNVPVVRCNRICLIYPIEWLLTRKFNNRVWEPVPFTRGGLSLSHLLFVDDVMLFCKATSEQACVLSKAIQHFCDNSSLKVNHYNFKFIFSPSVPRATREELMNILSIQCTTHIGKYLGFNLMTNRVTKSDFSTILDKVNSRLASWKGRLVNKAGRLCLALPTYNMQLIWLPQFVCASINKACRSMIWSNQRNSNC